MINESDIHSASILIVDDKESNIILLEQMLNEANYSNVTSTMDPYEVCGLDLKNHYDLILLDLEMPGMDGFQVIDHLNANNKKTYTPILVITAQPSHKIRALQAGAKDFISKPFDLTEVKLRIHNMLEIRLLYKKLENYNQALEQTVRERTAELRESKARYRSLAELASDWYWEQDETMQFTKVSGPVFEMLGLEDAHCLNNTMVSPPSKTHLAGWNEAERKVIQDAIAARQPFIDLVFHRTATDGSLKKFQVSGEPMFDQQCRFIGFRGIGAEVRAKSN